MKKSLLLSAAALVAALSVNAEPVTVTWDFSTHGIFADFQDPEGFSYRTGNYDFIDKYGKTVNTDGEQMTYNTVDENEAKVWHAINNRIISLYDGLTYMMYEDAADEAAAAYGYTVFPGTDEPDVVAAHPFIGWEQGDEESGKVGPARTIWMIGWGTLDAWADANYNAVDADNWVATKHALAMLRQGNNGSRKQTFVEFPEVNLPCKVTAYIGTPGGNYAEQLRATYQTVQNGEASEKTVFSEDETFTAKRYYKKEFSIEGSGAASVRLGCDNNELYLYHVVFEYEDAASVGNVAVDVENENAPIYNLFGQKVTNNYKGIVIQNGKKFIQK